MGHLEILVKNKVQEINLAEKQKKEIEVQKSIEMKNLIKHHEDEISEFLELLDKNEIEYNYVSRLVDGTIEIQIKHSVRFKTDITIHCKLGKYVLKKVTNCRPSQFRHTFDNINDLVIAWIETLGEQKRSDGEYYEFVNNVDKLLEIE